MVKSTHINYVEFPARSLDTTKEFFSAVFGWDFTDYGPDYTAFSCSGINGGFYQSDQYARISHGSALVVLYNEQLETIRETVVEYGGIVTKDIFQFPGGRRFHFTEPSGNELAIWSDK